MDTREFGGEASGKGVHMPKKSTGSRYTQEFKAEAVQLARSSPGRSLRQLAYELGVADQTLRNWVKQSESNDEPGRDRAALRRGRLEDR